jgi:F-type H+-transporting ATPase subunit gamma
MARRRKDIIAEFSNLPAAPGFLDVSAIGRVAVEDFLSGQSDEVYLIYTDFINMARQETRLQKLLPLEVTADEGRVVRFAQAERGPAASYIYEPGQAEILDEIIPRFTALQVYHAVLESLASEHAARMVAMKNATDSATELAAALQLEYNKARQQTITNEMLDIAGGAEALR